MTRLLENDDLAGLSALVTSRLGLRFPPDRWAELEEGVRMAAREMGVADVGRWVQGLLVGVPTFQQIQAIANQLTVGETYFFRQGEVFRLLAQQLLPPLLARRRQQDRHLNVWSAACSTGEEPYSLAIMLRETLPDLAEWRVSILGTDVSTRSLARASRATYTNWSFRDTPPGLKERHFQALPRGGYQLHPWVRDMVRFAYLNLVEDPYPVRAGGLELIFCRNALMYFSAESQELILHRLWNALSDDGYLVVGPCDTHAALTQRFRAAPQCPTIYQKRTAAMIAVPQLPVASDEAPLGAPAVVIDCPTRTAAPAWSSGSTSSVDVPTPLAAPPERATEPPPVLPVLPAAPAAPVAAGEAEFAQARAAADDGSLEAALRHCDRALAHDRLNPAFHYLRACVLQEMGRTVEALAAHRRVLFLDPQFVLSHLALGALLRDSGEGELARRSFAAAADILARFNRGDAVPGADGLTAARLHAVATAELTSIET